MKVTLTSLQKLGIFHVLIILEKILENGTFLDTQGDFTLLPLDLPEVKNFEIEFIWTLFNRLICI